MRSIEVKRTTVLFIAALMIAALAAGPAAPAGAANCDGLPGTGGAWSGEYTMTDNCTLAGTIDVSGSLTIHGNGHTIDAAGNQAFDVRSGESLALDNVTVTNGWDYSSGGAIDNWDGTVTVSNSAFSGNSADYGGAINNANGTMTVSKRPFENSHSVEWLRRTDQSNRTGGAKNLAQKATICQ